MKLKLRYLQSVISKCNYIQPDIIPEVSKAIIEPEKVIAPTAAPTDISIKLPSLIFPGNPKIGPLVKNAEMATKTAESSIRLLVKSSN